MGGGERVIYPLHAGCLCGAVRITLRRPPLRVGLCHCMTCRKETGSSFKHFAAFRVEDVDVEGGTRSWAAPGGAPRHFCPVCGSRLFSAEPGLPEFELEVGALDQPGQLAPSYESYVPRREPWLPDLGVPRYEGNRPTADTRIE